MQSAGSARSCGLAPDRLARGGPEPIVLRLEPPQPAVHVDVQIQLSSAVADAETKVRLPLSHYLDGLRDQATTLTYSGLVGTLPQELKKVLRSAQFTATHVSNGQVVVLSREGDLTAITAREQPQVRTIVVMGQA